MTNHTPGPWAAVRKGCGIWKANRKIAEVNVARCEDGTELQANLDVIAAAPELLAALKGTMVNGHYAECLAGQRGEEPNDRCSMVCKNNRAAIAKAEGRS